MRRFGIRLPQIDRTISNEMLPEVRRRHQLALIRAGGEPCLLYVPKGWKDDAVWDSVRMTARKADRKYDLYLNRTRDRDGNRIYGNDTLTVPSLTIAFPSAADQLRSAEEGVIFTSRFNCWTLWDPVLPLKDCILVRGNRLTEQNELYLIDNVTYSTYVNRPKSDNVLLHQEFQIIAMTDSSSVVPKEDLPTVEESLAEFSNSLLGDLTGVTVTGILDQSSETFARFSNAGSIGETSLNTWRNNGVSLEVLSEAGAGNVRFEIGSWDDNDLPFIVTFDFANDLVKFYTDASHLISQVAFSFANSTWYRLFVENDGGRVRIGINDTQVLLGDLRAHSSYSTLQPLDQGPVRIQFSTGGYQLREFHIMEVF